MSGSNEKVGIDFGLKVNDKSGTMDDVYEQHLPEEITIKQVGIMRNYDDEFAARATEAVLAHGSDVTVSAIPMGPSKSMGIVVTDGNPVIAITADVNLHLSIVIAESKLIAEEA